jgi:hypothetical protein
MDVAGAVRKDLARADAHDELGLRTRREQRIGRVDRRLSVEAQPRLPDEVDEEEPDLMRRRYVPHREEHPIAVVAGERDRPLVEHPDEARLASLVRAVRMTFLVDGREKEHVHSLNERTVVFGERVANEPSHAVRQPSRIELVLQLSRTWSIEVHGHGSPSFLTRPT